MSLSNDLQQPIGEGFINKSDFKIAATPPSPACAWRNMF